MENQFRLSSNNLYHFTSSIDTLKKILMTGFRFNLMSETLPIKDEIVSQEIFGVCFCDLKKDDSKFHSDCYGHYAIAITKGWGIKNEITPVWYVHENSIGIRKKYRTLNNYYRDVLAAHRSNPSIIDFDLNYLFLTIMQIQGRVSQKDLKTEINTNKDFENELKKLGNEYDDFYDLISCETKYLELFTKYLNAVMFRITELQNELIARDFFMRTYSEDFKCKRTNQIIKNKVLYDEREWRAIKIITVGRTYDDRMKRLNDVVEKGYFPDDDNIVFGNNDLVAILVENDEEKAELINYAEKSKLLVSTKILSEKIKTWSEYQE